jgi:hypothetical protein
VTERVAELLGRSFLPFADFAAINDDVVLAQVADLLGSIIVTIIATVLI